MSEESANSAPGAAVADGYRTNGFLFSDLRDYTRYVETHGDEAAAVLLARYRRLIRAAVGRFGGAEIKTEGDSFYVVFPSASGAVRCGLAIVEAATAPPDGGESIAVGIGVHAGETVETAEGYVGSVVNIAARICATARPGELLVSETVRALTRTLLPVRYDFRGRKRLKGIAEPIPLYVVTPVDSGVAVLSRAERRGSRPVAALAALVLAVVALGGVALFLSGLSGRAPDASRTAPSTLAPSSLAGDPTPMVSRTADPTRTTGGSMNFPTIRERRLLEQVPAQFQDNCGPSDDPLASAAVSITCPLALGDDADQIWYDRFATQAAITVAIERVAARHELRDGGCAATSAVGQATWRVGSLWSGRRACFEESGAAWIWWSYDEDHILARLVRRDGDWAPLLSWWNEYAILLRPLP